MNFPIRGDQLTIEDLRTITEFIFRDEDYQDFIEYVAYGMTYETIDGLIGDMNEYSMNLPVSKCNHYDCHGNWSDQDKINHHKCSLVNGYDCDICHDMYAEGVIPCKRERMVPKVVIDSLSHVLPRYELVYIYRSIRPYISIDELKKLEQRRYFKKYVSKDLIAEAMHPNRIQKQINQFDDIEAYFEAIGC